MLTFGFINGVSVGFELLSEDMVEVVDDNAKWGIRLELFIIRFVYIKI